MGSPWLQIKWMWITMSPGWHWVWVRVPLLDHMATPKHQGAVYYQVRVDADGQAHALLGFWGRSGAGAEGGPAGLMSGDAGVCVMPLPLDPGPRSGPCLSPP
jgi:hypothetical protein